VTIAGAGLTVGIVSTSFSDTVQAGNVISQNPAANTDVVAGTAVDLVVSLGQNPDKVELIFGSSFEGA
jgi:serine/threonine-protein kinase